MSEDIKIYKHKNLTVAELTMYHSPLPGYPYLAYVL